MKINACRHDRLVRVSVNGTHVQSLVAHEAVTLAFELIEAARSAVGSNEFDRHFDAVYTTRCATLNAMQKIAEATDA